MGITQVIKMFQQPLDFILPVGCFQHMSTDKQIQTLNILYCDRLIEHADRFASHTGLLGEPAQVFGIRACCLITTLLKMITDFVRLYQPLQIGLQFLR